MVRKLVFLTSCCMAWSVSAADVLRVRLIEDQEIVGTAYIPFDASADLYQAIAEAAELDPKNFQVTDAGQKLLAGTKMEDVKINRAKQVICAWLKSLTKSKE